MLASTIASLGVTMACLAQNIYFEARDQPTVGQMAVAYVVLNRVHHPAWPDTVCEVDCLFLLETSASSVGIVMGNLTYQLTNEHGLKLWLWLRKYITHMVCHLM